MLRAACRVAEVPCAACRVGCSVLRVLGGTDHGVGDRFEGKERSASLDLDLLVSPLDRPTALHAVWALRETVGS